MIQKITKIICDNCGQGITDIIGSYHLPIKDIAKNYNFIHTYIGDIAYQFCDEKCYKEWESTHAKKSK